MENLLENFSVMDFNWFDMTIAAIVLILGIKGFVEGFIKEVFGLFGLIGGVYFGSRLSGTAAQFIGENFTQLEDSSLLKLIGFFAILIIVWLGATILGAIISKLINKNSIGFMGRLFGFIVGAGKYFIIFALIVTSLSNVKLFQDNFKKYLDDSVLYPYLQEVGTKLIAKEDAILIDSSKEEEETTPTTN